MNFLKLILLSFALLHFNLHAQYDAGVTIHTENINTFDDFVAKKYIVVDFDGDYYFDVVIIKEGNPNQLIWLKGDENGNFDTTEAVTFSNEFGNSLPVLRAVDIDYDTDLDIFVMLNSRFKSTIILYENLALSPVCSPVLDLTDSPLTEGVYQAGATIVSSGNVVTGNNVTLKAANNIELQNDFEVWKLHPKCINRRL